MPLSVGQDIDVRISSDADPHKVVTEDDGAILLAVQEGVQVFLPSSGYPDDYKERRAFLQDLRGRQTIIVRLIDHDDAEDKWVVSRAVVLLGNPWRDEVPQWTPGKTVKRMRVTNVHADQVYGEIIPGVVGKISLQEIKAYLGNRYKETDVALVGDFLVGYVGRLDYDNQIVLL